MFKNVATKIALFAFDTTTGAAKTGDAANITAYVSKDYGAVTVLADTSATEMEATNAKGWYLFDVAQGETNADALLFTAKSGTANISVVGQHIFTTPASFTAFVTPTGAAVNATQFAGQTITAAAGVTLPSSVASPTNITAGTITTATNVTTVNGLAAGVITAASIAADAITDAKVASDVTIASVTGAVGSVTGAVGSVTGLTASDVGAIKTKTDFLPSATAGAAGGVFIAGSNAATTANITGNLTGNVSGSVGSVTGQVGSIATGGIAAASFAAGAIDAAAIATDAIDADALKADAVTEIQSGLSTLTAAGVRTAVGLASANLDTQLDALPTASENADQVWDELIAGHAVSGSTGESLANATAPTAAVVADAVWDEAIAGHLGAGSTGLSLNAAGSAGDPWVTALPGAYGAGSAGFIVGTNLNATVSSRATQTSVDDVPTNAELATALGTADDAVLAAVATAQTAIDAIPTNAELATALGTADDAVLAAIAGITSAPTAVQNADALLGRNLAGGSNGGRMVKDALRSLRNKTSIVAGTLTVTEEDDTTTAWTAVVTTSPGDPLTSIDPA